MPKSVLLIGRFVPFHNGHKYLVDSYLASGTPVCIAIRDTDEKYSVQQRAEMIRAVYPDFLEVQIAVIPDISQVAVGRGVGYSIARIPEEIEQISATKIREGKSMDVPPEVERMMKVFDELRNE